MPLAGIQAVARFVALSREDEAKAALWCGKSQASRYLCGFLNQVIPYQDSDLERLYVFLRHLAARLPRRGGGAAYQLDDEARLNPLPKTKTPGDPQWRSPRPRRNSPGAPSPNRPSSRPWSG